MSISGMRKEMKGIRESVKDRPLDVLLKCKADSLTDAELDKVLHEVPIKQIPSNILLVCLNREYGTSFKSIDELPEEGPIEWRTVNK